MPHSLQETKCDALLLLLLLQPTQTTFKQQQLQQQQKHYGSSMRIVPKRVDCISVIYIKFLYAYMRHNMPQLIEIYDQLLIGPNQIYPTF